MCIVFVVFVYPSPGDSILHWWEFLFFWLEGVGGGRKGSLYIYLF